ncbi:MAG TPA: 2-oxoglutarate dehydrogenase E1 component, partial [Verrucomicrobiae bacterium]|nr:2-oxoglutarate dehydrogenase E1 component [Verrucomicrobiae bacterium]
DSARGTFSQRHAVLYDYQDGHTYVPLQHLPRVESANGTGNGQQTTQVEIINSPLSEAGVMGFDYGYSLDCPEGLILWEAQYGDFVNAAQVIIDQFISSAEDKWRRLSGLVLLLPHGFEGAGPEHSSARLERFLALAAEHNMQITYPTTAAQYFHLLRRQVLRRWRKPLVVMTPKSLLRDHRVSSSLDELSSGMFQPIIPDALPPEKTTRILLCSGKVYWDLEKQRAQMKDSGVAIIRLEQLYPLSAEQVESAVKKYHEGTPLFWVQEEPENMGACRYINAKFGDVLRKRFPFACISRPESASPATGSHNSHRLEQEQLLAQALEQ